MKTRVIQNDPDEPGRQDARGAAEPKPMTNLAGRIGRWSAHHRKIAIFGWLAFVFVSFAVGMFVIGAKQATDVSGPGESGRALAILGYSHGQWAGGPIALHRA